MLRSLKGAGYEEHGKKLEQFYIKPNENGVQFQMLHNRAYIRITNEVFDCSNDDIRWRIRD